MMKSPSLPITVGLLALGFVLMMLAVTNQNYEVDPSSVLVHLGALDPRLVWQGEVFRLGASLFVHATFLQFLLNAYVLYQGGRLLEPLLGASQFLVVFLVAGIFSNAVALLMEPGFLVGFQGSAFGVLGCLLAVGFASSVWPWDRQWLLRTTFFAVLNVGLGASLQMSPLLAGLAMGALLGFGLVHAKGTAALGIGMLLFVAAGVASLQPKFLTAYHEQLGFWALHQNDLVKARMHAQWLSSHQQSASGQVLSSRILAHEQRWDEAMGAMNQALVASKMTTDQFWAWTLPNTGTAQSALFFDEPGSRVVCNVLSEQTEVSQAISNSCAQLFLWAQNTQVRDAKAALHWAKRAVMAGKPNVAALKTLASAYDQNYLPGEALQALDRAMVAGTSAQAKEIASDREKLLNRIESHAL